MQSYVTVTQEKFPPAWEVSGEKDKRKKEGHKNVLSPSELTEILKMIVYLLMFYWFTIHLFKKKKKQVENNWSRFLESIRGTPHKSTQIKLETKTEKPQHTIFTLIIGSFIVSFTLNDQSNDAILSLSCYDTALCCLCYSLFFMLRSSLQRMSCSCALSQ